MVRVAPVQRRCARPPCWSTPSLGAPLLDQRDHCVCIDQRPDLRREPVAGVLVDGNEDRRYVCRDRSHEGYLGRAIARVEVEAEVVRGRRQIDATLDAGLRTADIAAGEASIGTQAMTDGVISALETAIA